MVYRLILENLGGNQYDMPHTGIRKRETAGLDVVDYTVDTVTVTEARNWLLAD